jgi:hypothetical protein
VVAQARARPDLLCNEGVPVCAGSGVGRTTRSDGEEEGGEIYKDEMELIEVIERPLGRTYFSR